MPGTLVPVCGVRSSVACIFVSTLDKYAANVPLTEEMSCAQSLVPVDIRH
jgi:hypothetical protein